MPIAFAEHATALTLVVLTQACGAQSSPPPEEARAATAAKRPTAAAPARSKSETCARFEKAPVDMGVERATALGMSLTQTCIVKDAKLRCADRFGHGDQFAEVASDVARVAGSAKRTVCLQHTQGGFDCIDQRRRRFAFEQLDKIAPTAARTKALVLDGDTFGVLDDRGELQTARLVAGTDKDGQQIFFATAATKPDKGVRDITVAVSSGGEFRCALVGNREQCWDHLASPHRWAELEMPGPVVAIGGRCALLEDGRVACFQTSAMRAAKPSVVATVAQAKAIQSDDGLGGCAIVEGGHLTCFGDLGLVYSHGGVGPFANPAPVTGLEGVEEVAMLDGRACARTTAGRVLCFGCLSLPDWLKFE